PVERGSENKNSVLCPLSFEEDAMAFQTLSCPECGATVKSSAPSGKIVRCPKCKNTFRVAEEAPPAPPKKPAGAIKKPGGPAAKSRHREDDLELVDSPRKQDRSKKGGGNKTVPIMIGVGAVLVLAGGILLATGVFSSDDSPKKNDTKQTKR